MFDDLLNQLVWSSENDKIINDPLIDRIIWWSMIGFCYGGSLLFLISFLFTG